MNLIDWIKPRRGLTIVEKMKTRINNPRRGLTKDKKL